MNHRLLLLLFVLTISCSPQEICDDDPQSELVVRFKHLVNESVRDTIFPGVTVYGIREGRPDSLLYNLSETSRLVLPLDPHHSFSDFVMSINEVSDTIHIGHLTGFYLMSYTCGYGAIFTLDADSILHGNTLFYDLELISATVDAYFEQDEEHLWLYF